MYLLAFCDEPDVLRTMKIIVIALNIMKTVIPLIVIILGIKDFFGVITATKAEEKVKEAVSTLIRRIIAALIVFFIPNIIEFSLSLIDNNTTAYTKCIDKATTEGIKQAYYDKAEILINKVRKSLDFADYSDARDYVNKLEYNSIKTKLQAELKEVEEAMEILVEISEAKRKEEIPALKEKINKISNGDARKRLLDELAAKFDQTDIEGTNVETIANLSIDGPIVKEAITDSLRIWIHKNGTYYVSQIWVDDPYHQLNKFDSPQYGYQLYQPSELLKKAIEKNNLEDKLIIAFNASGFYLKDVYDAASVAYYPAYDKTSVGTLVITDGKVVRNAYNKAYKTWYIAGVDVTGALRIYEDENTKDAEKKKEWSETVIGTIRNTFTFAGPLILDYKPSDSTTSFPGPGSALKRQAICQVDKNNFILITGTNLTKQNLIDIMLKANCKTGTNFDGGGSIALLYKAKGSTNIETLIGNGRQLTEVGYFVEE